MEIENNDTARTIKRTTKMLQIKPKGSRKERTFGIGSCQVSLSALIANPLPALPKTLWNQPLENKLSNQSANPLAKHTQILVRTNRRLQQLLAASGREGEGAGPLGM